MTINGDGEYLLICWLIEMYSITWVIWTYLGSLSISLVEIEVHQVWGTVISVSYALVCNMSSDWCEHLVCCCQLWTLIGWIIWKWVPSASGDIHYGCKSQAVADSKHAARGHRQTTEEERRESLVELNEMRDCMCALYFGRGGALGG